MITPGGLTSLDYDVTFVNGTLSVTQAVLTVTANNTSRQYSDPNPTFPASYSGFVNEETLATSGVTGTPSLTATATTSSAPGNSTITATQGTLASHNYSFSLVNGTLNVTQEDARVTYTGLIYVATASATSSTATVLLSATIQDITAAIGDPARDANAGDIRNARVTFINRDTNTVIASNLPVGLVNAGDLKTGTTSYTWSVNIGSADSATYTVGVVVTNYYTRDAGTDNTVVTVKKPTAGSIGGGGYLVNTNSAGNYAGAAGARTNFGLNVKFNKSGSNLQGNVNIISRLSDGRVIQFKSNAIDSLNITSPSTGVTKATFTSKANVTDITNPLAPIALGGNKQLQIQMTDNGEPGSADTIAIQLSDPNGGLLYSSKWSGTATVEQLLGGGNLQVRQAQLLAGASGLRAPGSLTLSQLQPIIAGAKASWQAAGFHTDVLNNVTYRIDDLPAGELGWQAPGFHGASIITIDSDASGHGWFLDPTPRRVPTPGRVDLLTVVTHELGHILGFVDHEGSAGVMAETLAPGQRRLPTTATATTHGQTKADVAIMLAGLSRGLAATVTIAPPQAREVSWAMPAQTPSRAASVVSIGTPTGRRAAGLQSRLSTIDRVFTETD